MMKVKVIQVHYNECYECGGNYVFYPHTGDWEEIEEKDLGKLQDAIGKANAVKGRYDPTLILVRYVEDSVTEVFNKASEFVAWQKKQEEKKEKAARLAKEKREKSALERKRKQLEKLKKELGDES